MDVRAERSGRGTSSRTRVVAWALWIVTMTMTVGALVLVWLNRALSEDTWFVVVAIILVLGYATTGVVLASRFPRNPIGWLFMIAGFAFISGGVVDEWGRYALITESGSLPDFAVWLGTWASVPAAVIPLIFLLFPDGHPPTPRWRPLVVVLVACTAIAVVVAMFRTSTVSFGEADTVVDVANPYTVPLFEGTVGTILAWGAGLALLAGSFAAVASLVLRFRRAEGETRQQIRWLATAAAMAGLSLIAVIVTGIIAGEDGTSTANDVAFFCLVVSAGVGVPVATGIGVLKYRLYDLEIVVKKTLVFAVVATLLTALYGFLLFLVPVLVVGVGSGTGFSPWQFLVTILIALSFAPIRRRARALADRIVYGGRATPYEVLSDFSERLGETYSTDDVLPRMTQLLAASTGASQVVVLLKSGERLVPSTTWPEGVDGAPPTAPDRDLEVFPVIHQGEELGAIVLRMTARDPMNPSKEQLVRDVASQAGLVLRNVRLISDLRESRRRIVTAQDERAKRLERDIHDGAQQQLVALAVRLRLAEQMIDRDPARVRPMLAELQDEANGALENMRDLARGIYPPLLADKGLAAALEAQARKAALPVTIEGDGSGRYRADVEATVYFCTLEALQNVAKYAQASVVTVSLHPGEGELTFRIVDDGRGFDPSATTAGTGIQGMRDRVEALGGSLTIESASGRGVTVTGRVPTG
jgi:signal transduction histidine kinase